MLTHSPSQGKSASAFMDPVKIISSLGIDRDNMVADFGSGAGYFAIPMAKAVLPRGKVYAIDILPSALDVLGKKAQFENVSNIILMQADLEKEHSTTIADSSVDIALTANILFQMKNRANLFREAKRILKPNGKLVVIEWAPGKSIIGPADAERIDPDQVKVAAMIGGLKEIKQWLPDAYHYGFIFVK